MTKRNKVTSPTLQLTISEERHAEAVRSNSGGCLIADAIKDQYPHLSGIVVDMATIRVSDRAKGIRYTYLTPPAAQHLLLAFDQGWNKATDSLTIRRAVKVDAITRSPSDRQTKAERCEARIAELNEKLARGEELTRGEKGALSRMTNPRPVPPRPSKVGPVTDVAAGTVIGGERLPQGKAHPNLLRSRNRHFGAKLADPGVAFQEAVDQAVAQHFATYDKPSAQL